jgi:hypothetical protein
MATAGVVMGAILVAAMLAGVRRIAYGALAALVVAGLWPLLILLGAFAALMILAVLVGLVGGEGVGDIGLGDASEGAVRGGAKLASSYYRFLARLRHPVLWGAVAGAVAGTAVVWAILALYVVPRERRTLETLLHVQLALEDEYQRTGSFPRPTGEGTVPPALLDEPAGQPATPILDGFGRPILYDLKGLWKLASYTVSSMGFDGHPSDDDLCLTGGTRAGTWLQRAAGPVRALFRAVSVERVHADLRLQIAAIQASRCSAGH